MGNSVYKRGIVLAIAGAISIIACTGCGNIEFSENEQVFDKGVYALSPEDDSNSEKTTFYIIYGDGTGYIEDVKADEGTYFEYSQEENNIRFYFGFGDPYVRQFKVQSMENGSVAGSFDDDKPVVFEPVEGADPRTFDVNDYRAG